MQLAASPLEIWLYHPLTKVARRLPGSSRPDSRGGTDELSGCAQSLSLLPALMIWVMHAGRWAVE